VWIYVAAALAALAMGFSSGWKVATWRADSAAAELQRQTAADAARRFEHATSAARQYEVAREAERVRTVTITREVQREVLADADCSVRPLPDGLRGALERAAGARADQPGAAGPVPAASAASAADLGGYGAGLRRDPGGVGRLPLAPPSPG
jgi:hypothetical protein